MRRARGSAIAIVVAFLTFVAIVSLALSFQSSGLRRMQAQSAFRYFALEIAESAINEAASQVTLGDIFPSSVFGGRLGGQDSDGSNKGFFWAIAAEDVDRLKEFCQGGDCVETRKLTASNPEDKDRELFAAFRFNPELTTRQFTTPLTQVIADKVPGFKSITPVTMRPLVFRRILVPDDAAPMVPNPTPAQMQRARTRWENYGVLQYKCTVTMKGAFGDFSRLMIVDRLFTIELAGCADAGVGIPCPLAIYSDKNLKTVAARP